MSWQHVRDSPVLIADAPWEKKSVMNPSIIFDHPSQTYKMWYSAGNNFEPDAIGYATSKDGIAWIKHPGNPVFRASPDKSMWDCNRVAGMQVIANGEYYYMFYIGYKDEHRAQIGLARSEDGVEAWQRYPSNPIVSPTEGAWDGHAVYKPFAVYNGTAWLLWYNGRRGSSEAIGLVIHEGHNIW
jgi:predicted GH43/DUF377 family glycosyl hydrolase